MPCVKIDRCIHAEPAGRFDLAAIGSEVLDANVASALARIANNKAATRRCYPDRTSTCSRSPARACSSSSTSRSTKHTEMHPGALQYRGGIREQGPPAFLFTQPTDAGPGRYDGAV